MSGDCRRGNQAFVLLRAPPGSPTVAIGRQRPFSGIRRLDLAHGKVIAPGLWRSCRFAEGLATLSIRGRRNPRKWQSLSLAGRGTAGGSQRRPEGRGNQGKGIAGGAEGGGAGV